MIRETRGLTFSLSLKSTSLKFLNIFGRVGAMVVPFAFYQRGLRSVSQKSRNLSGLFRVLKFPWYPRNAEIRSHQIPQTSCFFLAWKSCSKISFLEQNDCSLTTDFSDQKSSRNFRETGPWLREVFFKGIPVLPKIKNMIWFSLICSLLNPLKRRSRCHYYCQKITQLSLSFSLFIPRSPQVRWRIT